MGSPHETAFLTVNETARMLNMSHQAVRLRIAAGGLDVVRVGTGPRAGIRLATGDFEDYLERATRGCRIRPTSRSRHGSAPAARQPANGHPTASCTYVATTWRRGETLRNRMARSVIGHERAKLVSVSSGTGCIPQTGWV